MSQRVVITGLSLVNALGETVPEVWRRLLAGENGITRISFFDATEYSVRTAAEVRSLEGAPSTEFDNYDRDSGLRSLPGEYFRRSAAMFLKAATDAFADAGLGDSPVRRNRIGVAAGHSVPYLDHPLARDYYRLRRPGSNELDLERFSREGVQAPHVFWRRQGSLMAVAPMRRLQLEGPSLVVDTACAASGHAIATAYRMLRRGQADAFIAGGVTALVAPLGILYFAVLGALSRNPDPETAARPFDRDRDGFVMGEGGGAVVLETLEHARARGARIYAELLGYGSTLNAHTITDPSPDGSAEAAAMRMALAAARLNPSDIDYVAAHGTSTPKNDTIETAAIKIAFGEHSRRLPVSSNKAQVGHTIAGAAVTNLICGTKAIAEGVVPPTMHYRKPDPECDLDYVPNQPREMPVRRVMANSFAFGGQNLVLVVQAFS